MLSLALLFAAHAAVVKPVAWTSTSSAADGDGFTYSAANVGDGKQSTAWVEGDEGSGLGASITADLGGEKVLTGLTVWGGFWYTQNYWSRYNRAKLLVVEFSDGSTQDFNLNDEFKAQTLTFAAPKRTSTVKLKIKGIYNGSTFNDSAIAEVRLLDANPDVWVRPTAYKASSTFPADNDGDYEVDNTTDGILDSMWCENDPKGDGTNQWVEYTFAGPTPVSKVVLRNGNAYSFSYFMKTNRANGATLTFDDGSTETLTIKDTVAEQTLSFPSRSTSKVKLTFTVVKKGSEYNDLCLSEFYLLP